MTLRPLRDVSSADWLSDVVDPIGPPGFSSYVRVLHPWWGAEHGDEDQRFEGHLPGDALAALVDVLALHTQTPDDCFHALWDGFGAIAGGEAAGFLTFAARPAAWPGRIFTKPKAPPLPPPAFAPHVMQGPRLRVAGRDHLLFAGPLSAVGQWGAASFGHGIPRDINSPNVLWPADHAWCVVTDIDSEWTGVGGSVDLAKDLLATAGLEVVRTRYDDRPRDL